MNETPGVVVRVEGDRAWVRTEPPEGGCGSCAQRGGCASASASNGNLLDGLIGNDKQSRLLCLPNSIGAGPGDQVMVRAADGTVLAAVGRVYGIPLILGMMCAIFTLMLVDDEFLAFAALLLGLGSGFFALGRRGQGLTSGEPILTLAFKAKS